MANFSVGANCFLGSEHKILTIGPNATTERGAATVVNAHPKEPRIIYPSGKLIVVKSLVDPNDCFIYRGHAFPTTAAKFSPNGFWVCSADSSGKVRVWAWDNPEHLTKLETSIFAGAVLDVDWDFESKKIVAVGEGTGIMAKVFTWDTGNSVGEMVGHNKRVLSCSYKPTRPFRVMTGSEDQRSILYSGPPFKLDHSNGCHTNFVNCVRYSPNGSVIASVGADKKIQLYDGATGQPTAEIVNAHAGTIYSVAFSPDSQKFLTSSADKTVKQWDVATQALEKTFNIAGDPQVGDMQVSVLWTAQHMLSVSLNGSINILDSTSSSSARSLQGHQGAITAMHLCRDQGILFTGSFDGVVIARNLASGETVRVRGADKRHLRGGSHNGKVVGLVMGAAGALWSAGWDDSLRCAHAANMTDMSYHSEQPLGSQPCAMAGGDDDLLLVLCSRELTVWRGGLQTSRLANLSYSATCVCVLSTGEVAVGGDDFNTHIYSLGEGDSLTERALLSTRSAVSALAFASSSGLLAVGDGGRQVEVFQRNEGGDWAVQVRGRWVFHTSKISSLQWSPQGNMLASGSLDESIIVWNMSDLSQKLQLSYAHKGGVSGLAWLNDATLVSAGNDATVVTWKVPSFDA